MTFTRKYIGALAAAIAAAVSGGAAAQTATTDFAQALARDYQALSAAESAAGDNRDAGTYAARAAAAVAGVPTAPDQVELRQPYLKQRYVAELSQARGRLVGALDQAASEKAPVSAARAQTSYDCWLEQATEDLQVADIDACKQSFLVAIADVEAALVVPPPVAAVEPPPPPAPVASEPEHYIVPFGFDRADLSPAAMAVLETVKADTDNAPATRIHVVGHASTIGASDYNMRLSQRRAEAVKAALLELTVDTPSIVAEAVGEEMPVVPTPDSTREPRNRVVEVTLER